MDTLFTRIVCALGVSAINTAKYTPRIHIKLHQFTEMRLLQDGYSPFYK
jgi:hypothetical protein